MNEFLLCSLIVLIAIVYLANGRNVVSPAFIVNAMFILSSFVLVLSDDYFGYEISGKTCFTVIIMIVATLIGELAATKISIRRFKNNAERSMYIDRPIDINRWVVIGLFLFVFVTGGLYFRAAYLFSLSVGNITGNFFNVASYTRFIGGFSAGTFLNQASIFSECVFYLMFYVFCYNRIFFGVKKRMLLLPMFGFVFYILANDGRTVIIKYLCICCIIYFVILKENQGWTSKSNAKIIKIGFISIISFLVLFRILGYRTGASTNNELWENLAQYISSGLIGLDSYLSSLHTPNTLFGQETFKAIYATLRGLGFNIINYDSNDVFFTYVNGRSNVYTGLKCFINDFSYLGALLCMFINGFVVKNMMKSVRRSGTTIINTFLLGLLFYPLAMMSVAASSHVVLCLPTIYCLVYLKILEFVFIDKKIRVGIRDC